MLAQDPFHLHAYWEIKEEDISFIREKHNEGLEGSVYTLRIYDVTLIDFDGTNANYWFDLDDLHMKSKNIDVYNSQATYCAEIGLRFLDGSFESLKRSNYITTPASNMSDRYDLIWKEVVSNAPDNVYVNIKFLDRNLRGALKSRPNWQANGHRCALSTDEIKLYYQVRKGLTKQLGSLKDDPNFINLDFDNLVIQTEKSIIPALMTSKYRAEKTQVASDEFIVQQNKKFHFKLDMELIVRGQTEPGAECYLGSKKIDLDKDGTFVLKWNLQDGVLPLDFRAKSPQTGLQKTITTSVIRSRTESAG